MQGAARFLQAGQDGGEGVRGDAVELHLSPGRRGCAQVCSGGDAVAHHPVLHRMEGHSPLDGDGRGARSLYLCAGRLKEALQVDDLWLPGSAYDGGHSGTAAGSQHGIFGGPHAGDGQAQLPAPQASPAAAAGQRPLFLQNLRPQGPEGGQVQVDGTGAQLAAPGVGQLRRPQPGQQRPQDCLLYTSPSPRD